MAKFATKATMLDYTSSKLVNGDAYRVDSNDILAQMINLPMGTMPIGDGWRIMTGNINTNLWARVCYRHEAMADLRKR